MWCFIINIWFGFIHIYLSLLELLHFIYAVTTLEVLHSPKDTQIEEHDTVLLVCKFKSSTKIKVWWEKQGDLVPDVLTRLISTTQFKSNNYFMVSFSQPLII